MAIATARRVALESSEQVFYEYVSPQGPTMTHLRGAVLSSAIDVLKNTGYYDRYVANLAAQHRDSVLYAISASWVPAEVAMAHAAACDALALSETELLRQGEYIATALSETLFGTLFRAGRRLGVDGSWTMLKQCGRVFPRLYQGGRCTVLQMGPKDAILELGGIPLLQSRHYRANHQGYMQGLTKTLSTGGFTKAVWPRVTAPHTAATLISWV